MTRSKRISFEKVNPAIKFWNSDKLKDLEDDEKESGGFASVDIEEDKVVQKAVISECSNKQNMEANVELELDGMLEYLN